MFRKDDTGSLGQAAGFSGGGATGSMVPWQVHGGTMVLPWWPGGANCHSQYCECLYKPPPTGRVAQPCRAGFPACRLRSFPASPEESYASPRIPGTGKSPQPAGWKACPTWATRPTEGRRRNAECRQPPKAISCKCSLLTQRQDLLSLGTRLWWLVLVAPVPDLASCLRIRNAQLARHVESLSATSGSVNGEDLLDLPHGQRTR
jgi:hypothetical protein